VITYRDPPLDAAVDEAQPPASTTADARVMSNLELTIPTLHHG
jgi:hypothetical protein